MPSANPIDWARRFLALPNDSTAKSIGVAFLVALCCSLVVSATAVALRPLRDANLQAQSAAQLARIGQAARLFDLLGESEPPRARFVRLATGAYVDRDPGTSAKLAPERDLAGLGRLEHVATVFEVREDEALKLVILPVRGIGYQSTLKGYLALKADFSTIAALTFYEHGETPGLGARIENDAWRALWPGKKVADADGAIRIEVVKGAAAGLHQVDGISGATRTGNGVTKLLRFWLGGDGYGPYLDRLREEKAR